VKNYNTYTRYFAEPLSDEIFLMRKFKMRIIFNVKISQSTVSCCNRYPACIMHF